MNKEFDFDDIGKRMFPNGKRNKTARMPTKEN